MNKDPLSRAAAPRLGASGASLARMRDAPPPRPDIRRDVGAPDSLANAPAPFDASLAADMAAIARIATVPTILRVVSEITGVRLALVARVTGGSWTACAVLDQMEFGLAVGGRLDVATTLCSEVRDSREPVVIEHASVDPTYCNHPTPKMYGFESYIAVPITRPNGVYFGNLCALDSRPLPLRDGRTLMIVQLFAELIALHLVSEEESIREREALSRERVGESEVTYAVTNRAAGSPIASTSGLFKPFFRTRDRRPGPGLGLGLYIAAEIARGHGGRIAVDTTPEGLVTFSVHLPRDVGASAPGS